MLTDVHFFDVGAAVPRGLIDATIDGRRVDAVLALPVVAWRWRGHAFMWSPAWVSVAQGFASTSAASGATMWHRGMPTLSDDKTRPMWRALAAYRWPASEHLRRMRVHLRRQLRGDPSEHDQAVMRIRSRA